MPIVENLTSRSQYGDGSFRRRSNGDTHRNHWAVVDGHTDGRYPSFQELTSTGLPIGKSGKAHLVFSEFRENGKPNDIKVGGLTLRECVVPINEAKDKERREALESTEECRDFLDKENLRQRVGENGLLTMKGELSIENGYGPAHQPEPPKGDKAPKATSGWTPERRAEASRKAKERIAAKAA